MLQLIVILLVAGLALGVYIHAIYERSSPSPKKYVNPAQLYINLCGPILFGSIAFFIISELLKFPEQPIFAPDRTFLYAMALLAGLGFLGSGMHSSAKMLSRFIDKKHPGYKINRFYHIYAGHLICYTSFMLFALLLSMFAIKHPYPAEGSSIFFAVAGMIFGALCIHISRKPRELVKFFWPIAGIMLITYLVIAYPHMDSILRTPTALFITSAAATMLGLIVIRILRALASTGHWTTTRA
ncbi:hypothetical protein HYY74_03575 [Candidatus Woesearchaeota archaeon]|nr:hypothetical protein [Candidatus Woesearchaeota archaeon]